MFANLKDQMAITNGWEIWCDEDGKFWNREIPFTVLEEREYQPEEKILMISEMQKKYFEKAKATLKENKSFSGQVDVTRLEKKWAYEYFVRKKYLPQILPDWIIAHEDMDLLAANICTKAFVTNIKKFSGQESFFHISSQDFNPQEETDGEEYLKAHPYIKESMECFVSWKWGACDYPGGEILTMEKENDSLKVVCSRRDDWDYTIVYTTIRFTNFLQIKNEYEGNIVTYKDEDGLHSNIKLDGCEISTTQDGRCKFHCFIVDEYDIYYDLIFACEDVSIESSDKLVKENGNF